MSAAALTALIARCRVLYSPRSHSTDAELLRRFAQQHDAAAFEELLERHAVLVWGVCRRILTNEADCEDAFQATFLALVRRAGAVEVRPSLGAWLHTVAVRVSRKALARSQRQQPRAFVPEPATVGDVVDQVSNRELFRIVDDEIERLPALMRLPLILCCLQGRTRDEAAEVLGCSVAAVKSRLERGRDLLRRRVQRRGVQLPAALLVLGLTTERIRAALWAKTMQSVLFTPIPELVALTETGVSAATIGKCKLLLAALLLVAGAAGAAGSFWMMKTPEPLTEMVPNERTAAEPKKQEAPRMRTDRYGDPLPDGAIARLGTVRWRHGFFVCSVAFSPDGKKIAAIGAGRDITLWDVDSGKEIRRFPNENKQPVGVAFSPDGQLLATIGRRDVVSIWNLDTGKLLRQVKCQKTGLAGPVFSPDGKTLAVGDSSGTIYFWDPITGAVQRRIESNQGYLYTLAFSPDGKLLASGGSRGKGENDGSVHLWDTLSGKEVRRLEIHTKEINKIAFSPDGKLLASSGWEDAIRLWDTATGRQVRVLTEKMSLSGPIAFSPDGTLLAVGHPDGTIRLWDTANGKQKQRWETGSQRVFTLAFSPAGKTLASAAGFATDIRLWDVATGREKHPTEEHRGIVGFLRFSPDAKELISIGSSDGQLLRWDLSTKTPRCHSPWNGRAADPLALSPDGNLLAVGARYPPSSGLRLWDVRTGNLVRTLAERQEYIWALAISPDGRLLASGYKESKAIDIWDINSGKKVRQIGGFATEAAWLCFSPDSKALACGMTRRTNAADEPTLRLWDVASGKECCSFDCHTFTEAPLAFSPDGKMLASGHGSPGDPPRQASMVRLWDATTGKELLRHTGPGDEICSIAFSPDGKLIASGCSGRGVADSVHVWEVVTGRLIRHLEGHHSGVVSMAFAPNGLTLASGAGDSTILLWDVTGRRADGRWQAKPLTTSRLDACWTELANDDAAKAYDAVWTLVAAPELGVPFLQKHLVPVPRPDAQTVARLLADLDSNDFMTRKKAMEQLSKFGDSIAPRLRRALDGKPSLEMRRRIQQLIDQSRDWTAERLRDHRAIQVLEHIGTKPARQVLQSLADGAPEAHRTEEAKAALLRIGH